MPSGKSARVEPNEANARRIVIFLGTIAILYFARDVLVPVAFALILAFLLTPAVTLLRRVGISRIPAVVFTVLIATGAVVSTGWLIATQLADVANELPGYRENIRRKIDALRMPRTGPFGEAARSLKSIGEELSGAPTDLTGAKKSASEPPIAVRVVQPDETPLTEIWRLASPSLMTLASTGVVLIFAIFILIEKEDLRNRVLRLAGVGQLNMMTEALDDAAKRVSRYLSLQLLVNACFGLMIGVGLHFIGVPNAALWGVVAGILRIIPYVGTIAAGLMPIGLSLAVFDHWGPPLLVFLVFATLELVTANLLEPVLYGAHTGISSLALLVTTVFWAALWGPAGLILSTPLTVCLVVLGRNIPQLGFLHILLGDQEALPPAAQLYQRLLAMDQNEARVVLDAFLKENTLLQLYDSVLVPALSLAEQDRHQAAIDSVREEFFFLNINEMVAEFSEYAADPPHVEFIQFEGRILSMPAHDQADEIAAAMLSQLLEQRGCIALSFPGAEEWEAMLTLLEPGPRDLICISALQPYAFAPARAACRRIRSRFPGVRIVAGMWGFAGEPKKALARFDRNPPDELFTSFQQVIDCLLSRQARPGQASMEKTDIGQASLADSARLA